MNPIIHQHDRLRLIIAVIVLVLLSCLSLMLGSTFISPSMLWSYIMNPMESPDQFMIEVLRLPRLVLALVAGAALGISGLLLQNVLKNPIASPDIIGVTGGATLGAVLFIAFVSGISIHFLPVFTLMGAGVATFILMAFQKRGNLQPTTLIIIGIALQTLFMALVSGLLVTTSQLSASKAYLWLVGSLSGATFLDSLIILGCFILMLPLLFLIVPRLNIATMTDEIATGLRLNVNQTKRFEMMITAVLTAAAISFVGNIGFVGLIAPHIAKTIIKGSYFKKLLMSAIVGGASLVLADLMGRLLFLPKEVPAGVFIAAFGAPFFIYLLLTVKKI